MSFVASVPSGLVVGVFWAFVLSLAGFGFVVGSLLARMVRARVVLVGSVIYWAAALLNWWYVYFFYYHQQGLYQIEGFSVTSVGFLLSMILVLCADITYVAWYLVKRRRTQLQLGQASV